MGSLPDYQYRALPQSQDGEKWIRVLDLLPSNDKQDPIKFRLRVARLDENLHYDAVSYVWGDEQDNIEVTIENEDSPPKIYHKQVRANLVEGLRVFRQSDRQRTLWADAICINQSDPEERSAQVNLMGLIFWLAQSVLMWLGRDDERIAAAVLRAMQGYSAVWWRPNNDPARHRPLTQQEADALDPRVWGGIAKLYRNPFFERVWVQQEVGLAKHANFFWGDEAHCCHHDVFGFAAWLDAAGELAAKRFGIGPGVLLAMYNCWINYGKSTREEWGDYREGFMMQRPFLVTLMESAVCRATDLRDHVYAFLGHPSARRKYAYRPEQSVNYLQLIMNDGEDTLIKPDYTKSVDEVFLETALAITRQQCDLRILGAVRHTEESLTQRLPGWVPRWDAIRDQAPFGVFPWEYEHRAGYDGEPAIYTSHFSHDKMFVKLEVHGLHYETIDRLFDFNDGTAWLQPRIRGRRFFRTKSEQDGIVPTVARPGDIVVILVGSYSPALIRHVAAWDYKFIGNCFIYGLVHGEMSHMLDRERQKLQRFSLI